MKNLLLIISILFLMVMSCTSNKKDNKNRDSITVDSAKLDENNPLDTNVLIKPDTTKTVINDLHIYGELNKESVAKHYRYH